tara:strand:- start:51 stop:2756 length:2706 start_codon:yes stop_codon:yes gene_type:complete
MAIQLNTQTAQQQKAPLSAFDSTSSYRSGLTNVAQGLEKVGRAAANIHTARNQQKEKAQDLLAYKANQEYSADFKIKSDALKAAIIQGDPDSIAKARGDFDQLGSTALDSYSSGLNLGNGSAQRYTAGNQANHKAASASFDTQESSRVIFGETTEYLKGQRTAATKAVVDNPGGLGVFELNDILSKFRGQDEDYQVRYDALTTPEQQDGFKQDLASNTTVVSMQNMKTARTLKELENRKQIVDEHTTHAVETLGMPTSSVERIENAYRAAKKALSDPTYKLKVGTEAYSKLNSSIGELFTGTSSTNMGDKVDKLAEGIVSYSQNHPESAAEHKEDLDGAMATLALFSPARDKAGNEVGESFVDSVALSFLRFGVKNTGNLQDFFNYVPEMEPNSARVARLSLKEQYDAIDPSVKTKIQGYIDNRTKLVMDGVNGGDLTALGNLYPRLERFLEKGEDDNVRMFYDDVVLPQLTGRGLGANLLYTESSGRGAVNGQLKLPTEWVFLGTEEVNAEKNPDHAATTTENVVVANAKREGLALVAISQVPEKTEQRMLETVGLRAAASGDNSAEVLGDITTRLQLASVNKNKEEIDKYVEAMRDELLPESDAPHVLRKQQTKRLTFLARIENLKGTADDAQSKFWMRVFRGHIAQGLNKGLPIEEAFQAAEDYHEDKIIPLFGVVAKSTDGSNVRLAPSTAAKFLDVDDSRSSGPLNNFMATGRNMWNPGKGKTNDQDLGEFVKASVIALAIKQNPDLYEDYTRGDMAYTYGTESSKPQNSDSLKELYDGMNNNEHYELGVGFFGGRGTGIPIVNIPETTFKSEKIPDGSGGFTLVQEEYYYLQLMNAGGDYEEGRGTYVKVDDVNKLLDIVVRRSTDLIPFNQKFGDILGATGNQNSVWSAMNSVY